MIDGEGDKLRFSLLCVVARRAFVGQPTVAAPRLARSAQSPRSLTSLVIVQYGSQGSKPITRGIVRPATVPISGKAGKGATPRPRIRPSLLFRPVLFVAGSIVYDSAPGRAGPVQGANPKGVVFDPFWGPIGIVWFVVCLVLLIIATYVWPRRICLTIYEEGFVYQRCIRRHAVRSIRLPTA